MFPRQPRRHNTPFTGKQRVPVVSACYATVIINFDVAPVQWTSIEVELQIYVNSLRGLVVVQWRRSIIRRRGSEL